MIDNTLLEQVRLMSELSEEALEMIRMIRHARIQYINHDKDAEIAIIRNLEAEGLVPIQTNARNLRVSLTNEGRQYILSVDGKPKRTEPARKPSIKRYVSFRRIKNMDDKEKTKKRAEVPLTGELDEVQFNILTRLASHIAYYDPVGDRVQLRDVEVLKMRGFAVSAMVDQDLMVRITSKGRKHIAEWIIANQLDYINALKTLIPKSAFYPHHANQKTHDSLFKTYRELIRYGLVKESEFGAGGAQIVFSLTDAGKDLLKLL